MCSATATTPLFSTNHHLPKSFNPPFIPHKKTPIFSPLLRRTQNRKTSPIIERRNHRVSNSPLERVETSHNRSMNPLEAIVAQIQGLSSPSSDIARLHTILKQSDDSLRSDSNRLSPILSLIDPSIHSLGFLYILDAFTAPSSSNQPQAEVVVPIITRFISACSVEQIRLAPEKFVSVCKRLKDQVMLLEAPLRGVAPLLTALWKLQVSSEHLTPLHAEFLLLCLLAKCYKTGLSILDDDVFEVDHPQLHHHFSSPSDSTIFSNLPLLIFRTAPSIRLPRFPATPPFFRETAATASSTF